jgi:hypothetical protein
MFSRKDQRFAVQLASSFSGERVSGEGTVVGLSAEGCALIAEVIPPISTYVAITIELPGADTPLSVKLAGVRWITGQKFGLEFVQIEPSELERLHEFMDTLEASHGP